MLEDESFLERLKQGAPDAYAELVDQFEAALYRFFFCDHRDHHVAEDQTAETFVQLVRSLPTMRGDESQLRAFVFATARHVQQRRWRSRRHTPTSLIDAQDVADAARSPETSAADREQWEQIFAAIGRLEDAVRGVMLLRYVEDLSIDEIAQALRMPPGTVKSNLHRGTKRLKQLLTEKECET